MIELRTEDQLCMALDDLSWDAPTVDQVMTHVAHPHGRRLRFAPLLAAAAVTIVVVAGAWIYTASRQSGTASASGNPGELVNRVWKLQAIDGRAVNGFSGLKVESGGRFWVSWPLCDGIEAHAVVTPTSINLTGVRRTSGNCPAVPGVIRRWADTASRLEQVIVNGTLTWSIHGSQLTVSRPGAATLVYSPYG